MMTFPFGKVCTVRANALIETKIKQQGVIQLPPIPPQKYCKIAINSPGARFSKVPITFWAQKAILCARCLHYRLNFCWF